MTSDPTSPTTIIDSTDAAAVLFAWAGADQQSCNMDMGGWPNHDADAFLAAVKADLAEQGFAGLIVIQDRDGCEVACATVLATVAIDIRAVRRFTNIDWADWRVTGFGDAEEWLLVEDSATAWWCPAEAVTEEIMDAFDAAMADAEPDSEIEVEAFNALCDALPAHYDDAVPAAIIAEARADREASEARELDDDHEFAFGW
jgi:hypothetical protein